MSAVAEMNKFNKKAGLTLLELLQDQPQPQDFKKFIDTINENIEAIFKKLGIISLQFKFRSYHAFKCSGFFECGPCKYQLMSMLDLKRMFEDYQKARLNRNK